MINAVPITECQTQRLTQYEACSTVAVISSASSLASNSADQTEIPLEATHILSLPSGTPLLTVACCSRNSKSAILLHKLLNAIHLHQALCQHLKAVKRDINTQTERQQCTNRDTISKNRATAQASAHGVLQQCTTTRSVSQAAQATAQLATWRH